MTNLVDGTLSELKKGFISDGTENNYIYPLPSCSILQQ